MSETALCPYCGSEYEKKENLWQCPHCLQTLPASEVRLTTLEAALCYLVAIDGRGVIGQGGRVVSMMMDLMPGNQKAVRLMKSAYLAAEPEIANLARKKEADSLSVDKLMEALHRGYIQQDKAEEVVSALLQTFQFDSDALLGGDGHGKVYALSHDLHMDAFARALRDVQKQNKVSIWKDINLAVPAMVEVAPRLKEETALLTCVGQHAGREFFLLMQTIGSKNFQKGDESAPMARLRMCLKEAYIDDEAIDFFLKGILKASNLEYTQSSAGKTARTVPTTSESPIRPRKTMPVRENHKSEDDGSQDPKWKAALVEIEKYNQAGDGEIKKNPQLARDYYAKGKGNPLLAGDYKKECAELLVKLQKDGQNLGYLRRLATIYGNLGDVAKNKGDYVEAKGMYERRLILRREVNKRTKGGDYFEDFSLERGAEADLEKINPAWQNTVTPVIKYVKWAVKAYEETGSVMDLRILAGACEEMGKIEKNQVQANECKSVVGKLSDMKSFRTIPFVTGSGAVGFRWDNQWKKPVDPRCVSEEEEILARIYAMIGENERDTVEAKNWYEKSAKLWEKCYRNRGEAKIGRLELRSIYVRIAECWRHAGDYEEAKKWYEKAFKVGEEIYEHYRLLKGEERLAHKNEGINRETIQAGVILGDIARNEGDYVAARKWYKKALFYRRRTFDPLEKCFSEEDLKQRLNDIKRLKRGKA